MGVLSGIYEDLMRFKPDGMSPNAWAMNAGVSRTVWADMRRHGNPSRRTLEKLLTAAGSSLAEFEALRIGGASVNRQGVPHGIADRLSGWGAAELPSLPVVATAIGGGWRGDPQIEVMDLSPAQIVNRVARPASLASDGGAYAIIIVGDSMWPRFRPGRRVAVSRTAPIAVGEDVLVKLKSDASGDGKIPVLVKEFVRRSGSKIELRQFNPPLTFQVDEDEIAGMEKVVGELI
ncbi:MAG TPA: S24 family peptidase [Sphingomicrobium sp.]